MVAELKLYWVIVNHCCAPSINLPKVRTVLSDWMKEWSFLFSEYMYMRHSLQHFLISIIDQPRSQFMEMSYNFAVLLAHCRSLRSQANKLSRSKLNEMVQRARDIISLAKEHTDERTPHLTDHIYHIITFSAITLCQLSTKYSNILVESNEVAPLRDVIRGLVNWLRSIGLASHISRVLANIIEAHYAKCTARGRRGSSHLANESIEVDTDLLQSSSADLSTPAIIHSASDGAMTDYQFQDFAWTSFFDFDVDAVAWPQGSELVNSNYTPTNESWSTSAHAVSP